MSGYGCEETRDLLPLLVRNQLLRHDASGIAAHLASCADCRDEAALVRSLAASAAAVPTGLEARVVLAVRRPRSVSRTPARLAMAATLAASVLGGSLVFQWWQLDTRTAASAGAAHDDAPAADVSWAVSVDPLLQGSSTLPQLSVEELELILQALDR